MTVCIEDTEFYNRASAALLGWDPSWFKVDHNEYGDLLEESVKNFQLAHGIKVDGIVGPTTFVRIQTDREAAMEQLEDFKSIKCGPQSPAINWAKVDTEKYNMPKDCYKFVNLNEPRNINKIVIHWDAALSSESCFNILKKRKYSTHFSIDNDGTIYQFLDTNHIAWHVKESNNDAIGIDISNAFYLKYNDAYEKRGFGKRPIITSKIFGNTIGEHLGYYPEQIQATKELIRVLCETYNIPLHMPSYFVDRPKQEHGIMFHYHLNKNKIDTAGFPLELIIKDLKGE